MLWNLSMAQLIVTGSFICSISFICGMFADKILGKTGFGVFGNWLILLGGAYAGMYVYNLNGYFFEHNQARTIFVVGAASLSILIFCMVIKRIFRF